MGQPFPRAVGTFVGRRAELGRVRGLLERETALVVYGLPGAGKSELVYKIVEQLVAAPPWSDAIAVLIRAAPGELLGQLAAELDATPTLADVTAALDATPHLLFIDDAHELPDEELGDVLGYVARRMRASRVVVASRRRLALPPELSAAVVIEVGPLDPRETAELSGQLAERTGAEPPDPAELHEQTFGSPGMIQRSMAAHAGADADELLADCFRELGAGERDLLALAAILGTPISYEELATAAGGLGEAGQIRALARTLADRFLLRAGRDGVVVDAQVRAAVHRLVPAADLERVRATAAAARGRDLPKAPEQRQREAVDEVAELIESGDAEGALDLLLETRPPAASPLASPALIDHLHALRELLPERAATIDLLLTRALMRQGRVAEARRHLDGATPPDAGRERFEYDCADAGCCVRLGQLEAAREATARAREHATAAVEHLRLDLLLADIESLRGRGAQARAAITEARATYGAPDRWASARCDASIALSYFAEESFEEAADAARRAARELGGDEVELRAAMIAIEILARVERDDVSGARAAVDALLALAGEAAARAPQLAVLDGIVRFAEGDMRGAQPLLEKAARAADAQRDIAFTTVSQEYLGRTLLALGAPDGAADVLARGTAAATAAGLERLALRGRVHHARALIALGRIDAAQRRLDATIAAPELSGHSRSVALRADALARALAGQLPAARQSLRRISQVDSSAATQAAVDLARAEVEMMDGDPQVAVDSARRARHYFRDCGRAWFEARAALALAAAYVARGGETALVGAERALARAKQLAEQRDYLPILLRAAPVEAGLARRRGDDDRVRALLVSGLRRANTVGGHHLDIQLLRSALDPAADTGRILPGIAATVAFLGLTSGPRYEILDRRGRRSASEHEVERELSRHDLVVDTTTATITVRDGESLKKRPTVCAVLARLIEARTQGVDAETLYCDVWGASEYQPLKHRNTVYVTLNRVRRALEDLIPNRTVIEKVPNGWRISDEVDACAVRSLDADEVVVEE